jgi:DNA-binding response OmpR family regulator
VLLVEDEHHVRRALARSLEAWGHDVTEADSVELARAALAVLPFDLLVLDINLPDGTGWDVLRIQPVQDHGVPPAIMISAIQPSVARIHEFRPLGVLNKPFPIDSLRRLVDRTAARTNGQLPG